MTELTTLLDNSNRFSQPGPTCPYRQRTIFIRIRPDEHTTGYEVHVWGNNLNGIGPNPHLGRIDANAARINNWVRELHRVWMGKLILWQDLGDWRPGSGDRYPFAEVVNLRASIEASILGQVWRELAKAGNDLFRLLFYAGDDRLKTVGDHLSLALREQPHVITVMSNDVVVPWSMLYVPPNPADELDGEFSVDPAGFLGYRHLVEHRFDMRAVIESHIPHQGKVNAGAYTNDDITGGPRGSSIVEPVVRLLDRRTVLSRCSNRPQLERELRGAGRRNHVLYFCCHCVTEPDGEASLRLGDDVPVYAANLDSWLLDGSLLAKPFVFINACNAARLKAESVHHFGRTLLAKGANCLVGPYVSIPTAFAGAFALGLLCRVLRPGQAVGEAVRSLTQHYADRFHNPLGLTFCLYHGIDSHLCHNGVLNAATAGC